LRCLTADEARQKYGVQVVQAEAERPI